MADSGNWLGKELRHLKDPIGPAEDMGKREPIRMVTFFLVVTAIQVIDFAIRHRLGFAISQKSISTFVTDAVDYGALLMFAVLGILAIITILNSERQTPRYAMPVMLAYLILASIGVAMNLGVLIGSNNLRHEKVVSLIILVALFYLSTTLMFSLWYQLANSYLKGGAIVFPPNAAHPNDPPRWFDYCFLSFNSNSTFGPTVEEITTRPAKAIMMVQVSISITILIVAIARISSAAH
jgi:hypothetical protein